MRKGEPSPFKGIKSFNYKHGLEGTRFCNIFRNMYARCNSPTSTEYKRYGSRGIQSEWKTLVDFKEDMYEAYEAHVKIYGEKNTSIDRINNDGNYSKENCRWSTNKKQGRNRRNNRLLTFREETKTMSEWAEIFNVDVRLIHKRLWRGWNIEDSLTKPKL